MITRNRTKGELKKLYTNIQRKGITDGMSSINVDVLWRDNVVFRTAGFYYPGGTDSIINFNNATRQFTIQPYNPNVEGYIPRFIFYSFSGRPYIHRIYNSQSVTINDEEGLYAFFFSDNNVNKLQELTFLKNPTLEQKQALYENGILISFIYWDATNKIAITWGDDRFGSEINPQQHWINHQTLHGLRQPGGLNVTNMLINQDGSSDDHAQFTISEGSFWHDDFVISLDNAAGGINSIPVMYFSTIDSLPRFTSQNGFQIINDGLLAYNQNGQSIQPATTEFFVAYHVFVTNDLVANQKCISVMGQNQYEKLANAFIQAKNEVNTIYQLAPQQGMCFIGSVIFQTSNNFTNAVKARVAGFAMDQSQHAPLSIAANSNQFLSISEEQELTFNANAIHKHIYNESPNGLQNQVNTDFTILNTPNENTLRLFSNGQKLTIDVDYTLANKTISFLYPPYADDIITCDYEY